MRQFYMAYKDREMKLFNREKEIIKLMDDKPILSEERYLEILQKIKEKKDREKNKVPIYLCVSNTKTV